MASRRVLDRNDTILGELAANRGVVGDGGGTPNLGIDGGMVGNSSDRIHLENHRNVVRHAECPSELGGNRSMDGNPERPGSMESG